LPRISPKKTRPPAVGVITYTVNGVQKVAATTGMISPAWPVQIATARVAILGVEGDAMSR
jgi:hypothetical protein